MRLVEDEIVSHFFYKLKGCQKKKNKEKDFCYKK